MRHVTDGELHAFLDGSLDLLPDGRGSEVRDHISGCSVCQERLQDEEVVRARVQEILSGAGTPEVALPSFEELRERAAAPGLPPRDDDGKNPTSTRYRGPLRGVPLAWAATIVLALGVGWMGGQIGGPIFQGPNSVPVFERYEDPDVSSLQRANLTSGGEEALEEEALPPEINAPGSPTEEGLGGEGSRQPETEAQAPGRGDAVAGLPALADVVSPGVTELGAAASKASDPPAPHDLLRSSAKVLSEPLFQERNVSNAEPEAQALVAEAFRRMGETVPGASASIPDSLENSLAVPGLKVVSIEWEERVAGEKALLIRQLLSPGDTLELRYLGMLLSADADVPREARASLDEAPRARMYANVLEASLPVGWNQVEMEWGRGLLVARAPIPEKNLKALLKSLH